MPLVVVLAWDSLALAEGALCPLHLYSLGGKG